MTHTHKKKSTHRRPKRKLEKWETIVPEVNPGIGPAPEAKPRWQDGRWRSNAIAPPPNWGNKGK